MSERKLSAVNLLIERSLKTERSREKKKKAPPKPTATTRLLAAFRCKTQIFLLSTNRLTKTKFAGFPGIATDLF